MGVCLRLTRWRRRGQQIKAAVIWIQFPTCVIPIEKLFFKKNCFRLAFDFRNIFLPPGEEDFSLVSFFGFKATQINLCRRRKKSWGIPPYRVVKRGAKRPFSSPHVALLFAPRKKSRAKGRRRDGHPNSIRHSQGSFLPLHPPITLQVRDSSNYQPISVFSYWTFVVSWLVYFVMKISHKL